MIPLFSFYLSGLLPQHWSKRAKLMKIVLQRVRRASVEVDGAIVGSIDAGLLLLVGFGEGDSTELLRPMAEKVANLRVFPDEKGTGRFDRSVLTVGGEVLVVPQFTLFADTSKGRRPEFFGALKPELARPLVGEFCKALREVGITKIAQGEFGAHMIVSLENDGPVTILLDSSRSLSADRQ